MRKNKFIFIYLFTDARVGNKKKYWFKFILFFVWCVKINLFDLFIHWRQSQE